MIMEEYWTIGENPVLCNSVALDSKILPFI